MNFVGRHPPTRWGLVLEQGLSPNDRNPLPRPVRPEGGGRLNFLTTKPVKALFFATTRKKESPDWALFICRNWQVSPSIGDIATPVMCTCSDSEISLHYLAGVPQRIPAGVSRRKANHKPGFGCGRSGG